MSTFKKSLSVFLCMVMLLGTLAAGFSALAMTAPVEDHIKAYSELEEEYGDGSFLYLGVGAYDEGGNPIGPKVVAGEKIHVKVFVKGNINVGYKQRDAEKKSRPVFGLYVNSDIFSIDKNSLKNVYDNHQGTLSYSDPEDVIYQDESFDYFYPDWDYDTYEDADIDGLFDDILSDYLWCAYEDDEDVVPFALRGLRDINYEEVYDIDDINSWQILKFSGPSMGPVSNPAPFANDDWFFEFDVTVNEDVDAGDAGSICSPETFYSVYCGAANFADIPFCTDPSEKTTPEQGIQAVDEFLCDDAALDFTVAGADETVSVNVKTPSGETELFDIPVGENIYSYLKDNKLLSFYRLVYNEEETKYVRAVGDSMEVEAISGKMIPLYLDTDEGTIEGETEFEICTGDIIDVASFNANIPVKDGVAFAGWDLDGEEADGESVTVKAIYKPAVNVYIGNPETKEAELFKTYPVDIDDTTMFNAILPDIQKDISDNLEDLTEKLGFTPSFLQADGTYAKTVETTTAVPGMFFYKMEDGKFNQAFNYSASFFKDIYLNTAYNITLEIVGPEIENNIPVENTEIELYKNDVRMAAFTANKSSVFENFDIDNYSVHMPVSSFETRTYNANAFTRAFIDASGANVAVGTSEILPTAAGFNDAKDYIKITETFISNEFKVQLSGFTKAAPEKVYTIGDTIDLNEIGTFVGTEKSFTIEQLIDDATVAYTSDLVGEGDVRGKHLVGIYASKQDRDNKENNLLAVNGDEVSIYENSKIELSSEFLANTNIGVLTQGGVQYKTITLWPAYETNKYDITFYYMNKDSEWKEITTLTYDGDKEIAYTDIAEAAELVNDGEGVKGDCEITVTPVNEFSLTPGGAAVTGNDKRSSSGNTKYYLTYKNATRYFFVDFGGYQYAPAAVDAPEYGKIIYSENWETVDGMTQPAINAQIDSFAPVSSPDVTEVTDEEGNVLYVQKTWKEGDAPLPEGEVVVGENVYNQKKNEDGTLVFSDEAKTVPVADMESPVYTDETQKTDPKGSDPSRIKRDTEFIGWDFYYVDGLYSSWDNLPDQSEWKAGWPDESKTENGYTATVTHIVKAKWIDDSQFLIRVYTGETLKFALAKNFKTYYWKINGTNSNQAIPCKKSECVMNDSPDSTMILFYKPVFEKNTYTDKDGQEKTSRHLRFDAVVLSTSALNMGGYLSIINIALDLAKGAI